MRSFAVGDTLDTIVDPRVHYVPTGILVAPGERYVFSVSGKWKDGAKDPCGPDGWGSGLSTRFNRLRGAPFFLLCGSVGRDDRHAFRIGANPPDWPVPSAVASLADRQLYLFANDWWGMYWNNRALEGSAGGPLRVRITRIA